MVSNSVELYEILHQLTKIGQMMRRQLPKQKVPEETGLYSIFVDSTDDLPPNFRDKLDE